MNIYVGENVVIKDKVSFGKNCSIWHNTVIRGDSDMITIGDNTNIQDLVMVHTGFNDNPVLIGSNVTIGHSAIIHGCTIEDNCLIGMGSIIMNDSIIHKNCIVGAGSLITEGKEFEEGSLILGSPAKVVRKLTQEEIQSIQHNADLYIQEAKETLEVKQWEQ